MLWSSDAAWAEIIRRPPSTTTLMLGIALPAAALPPDMLLNAVDAGTARYLPALPVLSWQLIALALFLAQFAGLAVIHWLVNEIAQRRGGKADRHAALMLATIAVLPLWLSSFVLLQDEVLPVVVMPLLAIGVSVALLRRGAQCVLGVRESLEAFELGVIAINGGMFAWAAAMAAILLPCLLD
jgi:hypothetical protein